MFRFVKCRWVWYNLGMIKIEVTRTATRKQKATEARKQEYTRMVVKNFQKEVEANPELLGTVYHSEQEVAFEIIDRVEALMEMDKAAEEMRGGWIGDLKYKLAKR